MTIESVAKTSPRQEPVNFIESKLEKLLGALRYSFSNFGPIISFYVVNHFWGLRPAVLSSLVCIVIEVADKYWHKKHLTLFFKFCAATALVFGGIDLYLQKSVFFKYEAALTNLFTAAFFGSTLFGEKTIILQFAESRIKASGHEVTSDQVTFFRLFTMLWTGYFVIKSGVYVWIAHRYGLEKGLIIRAIVGNVSLYALIGISMFGAKPIFMAFKKWGLLSPSKPVISKAL